MTGSISATGAASFTATRIVPPVVFAAAGLVAFAATCANVVFLRTVGQIAILWPTDALLLSFIVRAPRASWPTFVAIGYVANVMGNWAAGNEIGLSVLVPLCNAMEQIVIATALFRMMDLPPDLSRARNLAVFGLLAGVVGPLLSGVLGAAVLSGVGGYPLMLVFKRWVISHMLGNLTIAPLLIMLRAEEWRQIISRHMLGQTLVILLVITAVSILVFGQSGGPYVFFVFPFLILAAFRLRFVGAALAIAIVAAIAIPLTLSGFGPFAAGQFALADRIVPLQIFLAVTVFTLFPVAAVLAERRRLEEDAVVARRAAEQASQAKSAFLAHMSHELRTPMTGIIGICDLLRAGSQSADQRSLTEALQRSARAFVDMLNDVLDLAKIEAGRMELETTDFRLSYVMSELKEFFAPAMSQKGLAFEVRTLEAAADAVRGDPRRLRQVLLNLLGNALKFTDSGSVALSLRAIGRGDVIQAEFEVADTGIGIGEDTLHRLFQPFEQGDTSTSRRFGGTGLGLHICKQLVAEMGGEISVTSRWGQGSQFRFSVPLALGEEQSITERSSAPAADSAKILEGLTLSILVAEDNPTTQLLITQMMELWGHKIVLARDGAEAIAKVCAADFDVILMDMQMPVMDGLQATRQIRKGAGRQSQIPIIAVTADAITEHHVGYYAAGVNAVVTKPIAWDVLARRIKALVSREPSVSSPAETVAPAPLAVFDPAWIDALKAGLNANAVKALLLSCLDSMDRYSRAIGKSIAAGDHAAARRAAHDLKGICGQFGALQAGDFARRIENEAHDGETLQRIAQALEAAIDEASTRIRRIAETL